MVTLVQAQTQRLFTLEQRAGLKGRHPRLSAPSPGAVYVAAVALPTGAQRSPFPTTVAVGEVQPNGAQQRLHIVHHVRAPAGDALHASLACVVAAWGCQAVAVPGAAPRGTANALVAAVAAGGVAMYRDDGSADYQEFWAQIVRARMDGAGLFARLFVEPATGDDGYLNSMALLVEAALEVEQPGASTRAA